MHLPISISNFSKKYFCPSGINFPLGLVTISIMPNGQYFAQDAQPVHLSSYQLNSSPRNLGCCFCLSVIDINPNKDLIEFTGCENKYLTTFELSILAKSRGLAFRSGY